MPNSFPSIRFERIRVFLDVAETNVGAFLFFVKVSPVLCQSPSYPFPLIWKKIREEETTKQLKPLTRVVRVLPLLKLSV